MSSLSTCLWLGRFALESKASFTKAFTSKSQNYRALTNLYSNKYSTISEDKKPETKLTEEESEKEGKNKLDPVKQLEELNNLFCEATKQRDELNDKYKRALADSDNMRKRLMKQIEEAKIYGIQSFCKDLLEVADVLGKATECVPKEEVKDSNPHLKNLFEGLTMTESELHKVFKRHGLVQLNPLNEKFDPNMHEALFQQEVEGKAPGTVVVVSKIGYKLHDRVVRPALVGVAKG
ncbi:grpE protein homolog, mitochondrial Roe1 [Rhodnius prolixus]|uniref:GrpE protein homolog n=2 Tax=Rhodnius TaxID=13248 RepID=T1HP54_RHOPR